MKYLDEFVSQKPTGLLYHYTGALGLIGIIEKQRLWATDYRHLNDRKEYRLGAKLLQDELATRKLSSRHRYAFQILVAKALNACYVLSFSEQGDQLSQWRAYCPGGNGYSLGFTPANALFGSAKQHAFNLIRCEYDRAQQKKLCVHLLDCYVEGMILKKDWLTTEGFPSTLEASFNRYQWNLSLALVLSALKHRGFREEEEWRLVSQYPDEALYGVSFRPGRFGITPYFEMPTYMSDGPSHIDEVTVGPTANRAAARSALKLLLSTNKVSIGAIKLSPTPFRH